MKHGCKSCLDDPTTVDHVYDSPPDLDTPEPHLPIGTGIPWGFIAVTSFAWDDRMQSADGCDP